MPLARPHVPNLFLGARVSPLRVPSPTAVFGAASPLPCPSPRQGVSRGIILGSGVGSAAAPPSGSASVGVTPRVPVGPGMAPQPTYGRLSTTYAVASAAPLPHGSPIGEWRFRSSSPVAGGTAGCRGRNHSARAAVGTTVPVEMPGPTGPSLQELEREHADLEEKLSIMRAQRKIRALRGEVETERLLADLHALQQHEQLEALREAKARFPQPHEARLALESAVSSGGDVMQRSARLTAPIPDPWQMTAEWGAAAGPPFAVPASARGWPSQARATERPPDASASPQHPSLVNGRELLGDEHGSPHSAVLRADGGPSGPLPPPPSPAAVGGSSALGSATTSGTVEAPFESVAEVSGEASASADRAAGLRQLGGARGAEVPPLPAGAGRDSVALQQLPTVMWTPNSNSRRTVPKA